MRVGMKHTDDCEAGRFRLAVDSKVRSRVHRVDLRRGGGIAGRVHARHGRGLRVAKDSDEKAAALLGKPRDAVSNHLGKVVFGEDEPARVHVCAAN